MNLDLFRVLMSADQEAAQQFIDYDLWRLACMAFGVTDTQCGDYSRAARAFAATTFYPNDAVVEAARRAALEALQRGEPLPTDVEQAVQALFARQLAAVIGL